MAALSAAPVVVPAVAPTRVRHGVLAFTLALTAVVYLDRVCIATAAPAMKADLALTDAQMGYVFSAFTFAYAIFEVPSGWLADRFGALSPVVVGLSLQRWGSWNLPLLTVAGFYLVAAVCWLAIDPADPIENT